MPSDSKLDSILIEVTKRITQAIAPEKIYLFGSHAWGHPTVDSDIDLFVIVNKSDQPAYRRSRAVYKHLHGLREPIEIVVRTKEEVERGKSVTTSLTRKVLDQGKLIYG